jgi:hypothetical protein
MILPILERELTWLMYSSRMMIKSFTRMRAFTANQASSSVDVRGQWD